MSPNMIKIVAAMQALDREVRLDELRAIVKLDGPRECGLGLHFLQHTHGLVQVREALVDRKKVALFSLTQRGRDFAIPNGAEPAVLPPPAPKTVRAAIINMPCEVLAERLGLPKGAVIRRVDTLIDECAVARLLVEHPDLPQVTVGNKISTVNPVFTAKGFKSWS